ncbi:MAG: hypothetical protein JNJ61_07530, partial [Anaerolineae bacterium]|nr:hypothetical protein [Anaerolineae bacterium]
WQQASYTPAAIDLMWLLMSGDFFTVWQEGAAYYRQQLAAKLGPRFDPDLWQEMVEVACLVEVLTKGVFHALFAATSEDEGFRNHMKQSVATYSDLVRNAAKWL